MEARMKNSFSHIPEILYEGVKSKNPFAFKYYNAQRKVSAKTMEEHLRFSLAYWHSFCAGGTDPFGLATWQRPWNDVQDPLKKAASRVHAMFDFAEKLAVPFFCFHDRDLAPEMDTLSQSNKALDSVVRVIKKRMKDSSVKLLWGTANLFSHPRYMHGAATSPDPRVFAHAAAQVKKAMEITKELGGSNYVFWGGREGYETLLNTDMQLERDNLARFMHMAKEYAKEINFTGQLLVEPKPKEPTKHQYDFDVAAVIGFLHHYDLIQHVKLNIETNHATLSGHSMQHELYHARIHGLLGSVDANQGDLLLGWDTDQFPTDIYTSIFVMYEILKNNGLGNGGLNFDAKLRRGSYTLEDMIYAHIAGMDTFARGLLIAEKILKDGALEDVVAYRYEGYTSGIGEKIVQGATNFSELATIAHSEPEFLPSSGNQELLEALVNTYI